MWLWPTRSAWFSQPVSWGTHLNIAGGAVAKYAKHPANAVKFLEYLASPQAQEYLANGNNEWPAVQGIELGNPALKAMTGGKPFKSETIPISAVGANNAARTANARQGWAFLKSPCCTPGTAGFLCRIIDVYVNVTSTLPLHLRGDLEIQGSSIHRHRRRFGAGRRHGTAPASLGIRCDCRYAGRARGRCGARDWWRLRALRCQQRSRWQAAIAQAQSMGKLMVW